jgi:hypothetical protein
MLTVPSVFVIPKDYRAGMDRIRRLFGVLEGDHLTLLNGMRISTSRERERQRQTERDTETDRKRERELRCSTYSNAEPEPH